MNRAYVAGIVDGEGHIGFARTRTVFHPRVLVVNTCRELLDDLQAEFGGDIHPLSRKDGWKQAFQWRLSNSRCVQFLDEIYPWLRIKAELALLVFAWDEIRPGRGTRWTPDGIDALNLIMDQAKWLTKRGSGERGPEPVEVALTEIH